MGTQVGKFCLRVIVLLSLAFLSSSTEHNSPDFNNYGNSASEFQLRDSGHHIIHKRPTVLLNRLMYALQNAIQPDERVNRQHQELERRGYPKHYWKCYFNAVSCFRRKRQDYATSEQKF
ncbi:uncharacterized protein LOC118191032 [Stegodyphus dumicola]|uniref:uncharacterized protein LOC118191032 n=1 Tax=Stegodyphus dumicola TaxID=202533 RepID=UPI0015AB9DF2|nr:uncharacterized protein LOC118191032 [Stegodyphus dumicola]